MKPKKEKKRWGLILFIILIMVGTSFSFIFYGFSPVAERVSYKGFSFSKQKDIWIAKVNDNYAAFSFLPSEVENILVLNDSIKKLQGKLEIDATSNLNDTYKQSIALAEHQMGLTLAAYNVFARKGFTENNTFELPIINCNDSSLNVPVIYFKYSNATSIHSEDNCIIAEASTNADVIRIKDRLLYGILGVIK